MKVAANALAREIYIGMIVDMGTTPKDAERYDTLRAEYELAAEQAQLAAEVFVAHQRGSVKERA